MYNKLIDHTLLKANATEKDVIQLCKEAKTYDFMSVCINPAFVSLAKQELAESDVYVCTVIGFPLGANTIEVKVAETIDAINNGADEIDMVINISKVKDHDFDYIYEEIKAVVDVSQSKVVKVIIETCYLTDKEKVEVCKCASLAGALFVKTSTGFGTGGASVHDVKLMRDSILSEMSVKASGGIRDLKFLKELVEAGASRIGASSGVAIMKELNKERK
ncbi:MAG: deoxyribose-phosphate aldolase [Bacilli bacterium]|jgi:deoxyribose-phosphate aldolase|nr:deoxyribose-phosphate aldolase [Bacilli bacterium]MDD2681939.1 deoxyribose-phosphate aldolase [Bacilli bacterium]MDD3121764.1 deoxyribose-phosphate aldolase [Bacilli bacterium]MDD4063483.1 deoxyribose-phosphate aldolase [Bacilli bacterium]MDD4481977.1 deoxyribose-phosphate aldolase [Bacilli bacterium]